MSGLLHSVQTSQVAPQPSLCWEWELTMLVNKECVPGRVALRSPRFQMKTLLIWNILGTYGKRLLLLPSRSFRLNGSAVTDELWACASFLFFQSCILICFFFRSGSVLSPPISVINWNSRTKMCVNKCTSKMIMLPISSTGCFVIHLMWFVGCCNTLLKPVLLLLDWLR